MLQPKMKELLEAGVHFGHQTRRWNPKMRRFILAERSGIYLIDLHKTLRQLQAAERRRDRAGCPGGWETPAPRRPSAQAEVMPGLRNTVQDVSLRTSARVSEYLDTAIVGISDKNRVALVNEYARR